MKSIVATIAGIMSIYSLTFATKHTISTAAGFTFDPVNTEMNAGDTIVFNIGSGHTGTEVSQSTWNVNGTTPSGAFNLSPGNNQEVIGLSVGVHYFVCQVHVGSMGMKGTITVNAVSTTKQNESSQIKILPNPVRNAIQLEDVGKGVDRIILMSVDGKTIHDWQLDTPSATIPVNDLAAGTYFLSGYNDDKQIWIQKFQKQ